MFAGIVDTKPRSTNSVGGSVHVHFGPAVRVPTHGRQFGMDAENQVRSPKGPGSL